MRRRRPADGEIGQPASAPRRVAPGKRTLVQARYGNMPVMRKAAGRDPVVAETAVQARVDQASRDGGQALDDAMLGHLEAALGTNLSGVRVHTGSASAEAADALSAKAFATGQDIHFAGGAYDPASRDGQHLIAHEVAHTVQQRGGGRRQMRSTVSSPADPPEREADTFADAFVAGTPASAMPAVAASAPAAVHCYDRDEHRDLPTRHLEELHAFLATPEGESWARDKGYDPKQLRARMTADPVIQGAAAAKAAAARGQEHRGAVLHGSDSSNPGGSPTEFTYGEMTALMGDLFATWQELASAPPEQRDALMNAKSTADYQKHSGGQYVKLAKQNDSHFADEAKAAWLRHHTEAINTARNAGADDKQFDQALFIEAAGSHFLTDAFSSGHLFNKATIKTAVLLELQRNPIQTTNPQMQAYVASLGDDNTAQLMVKLIHDYMNEEGFVIRNGLGMEWRSLGDGHLHRSPETQRIIALAVFESRQQVFEARRNVNPDIGAVEAFFPSFATRDAAEIQALGYIRRARKDVEVLIYKERASAPGELGARIPLVGKGLGKVVEANLDAIGDPGREPNILRNQELDRASGRDPVPAPSFTVIRW